MCTFVWFIVFDMQFTNYEFWLILSNKLQQERKTKCMREEGTYRDTTYLKKHILVGGDKFRNVILPISLKIVWWTGMRGGGRH